MNMNGQINFIKVASSYIRLYRDKVFVIKLGGSILDFGEVVESVTEQCTLLTDIGIRVVLVHGGGVHASELSRRLGFEPVIVAGRRVTDDATLDVAKMIFAGKVNVELLSSFRRRGAKPVGLSGIDAGLIVAQRRPPVSIRDDDGAEKEVDFGHVGDIQTVNAEILQHLLVGDYLPVISSLGADEEGNAFNINADTMAEAIAVAMKAKKLIYLTDRPGILRDPEDSSTLVPFADSKDLQSLLASGVISGGMRPKVEACIRAATSGVKRTYIIDGTAPNSLLTELFTGEGCGTMIVGEREKRIYQEQELG